MSLTDRIAERLPSVDGIDAYNGEHAVEDSVETDDDEVYVRATVEHRDPPVTALLDGAVRLTEAAIEGTEPSTVHLSIHSPDRLARVTTPEEWRDLPADERRHRIIHATEIE